MILRPAQRNDAILGLCALVLYLPAAGRYGWKILLLLGLSILVGAGIEWAVAAGRRQRPEVWGVPAWILLPLVLPPALPVPMGVVSMAFAILVSVAFFGGHGRAVVAPVAVAWAFAQLSFPGEFGFGWSFPFPGLTDGFRHFTAALPTVDHPLVLLQNRDDITWRMLLSGDFPQSPAMALPALVIALGATLLILRAICWRTALGCVLAYGALSCLGGASAGASLAAGFLAGDLLFAALFVLADERLCARTRWGRVWTGLLAGVAAFCIRRYASFEDGAFFAVLLANILAPLLDEAVMGLQARRGGRP